MVGKESRHNRQQWLGRNLDAADGGSEGTRTQQSVGKRTVGQRTVGQRTVGQRTVGQRTVGQRTVGQRTVGQGDLNAAVT